MFRYLKGGRLQQEAFTSSSTILPSVLFGLIAVCIYSLSYYLDSIFLGIDSYSGVDLPTWVHAIFVTAVPTFFMGFILSYTFTKLISRSLNYPATFSEVMVTDEVLSGHRTETVNVAK